MSAHGWHAPTGAVARTAARWEAEPERYGLHLALLVVRGGEVVAEHYGATAGPDTALISWSMAKSVVHALVGFCVADGLLATDQPAPVGEWRDDARSAITIEQLLTMTSGLRFVEDYVDAGSSDVIEMLFGSGRDDVAGFAAAMPLVDPPGSTWSYASGTSNILARIVGDAIAGTVGRTVAGTIGRTVGGTEPAIDGGGTEAAMRRFLRDRLFEPLGMTSADPRFDAAGTFVGSSFLYATARDFARFGALYLNGGRVGQRTVLPAGWVATASAPPPAAVPDGEEFGYGHHWWTWERRGVPGAFAAHGYEGQYTVVDPSRDLVVVRLGKTPAELRPNLVPELVELVTTFPTV